MKRPTKRFECDHTGVISQGSWRQLLRKLLQEATNMSFGELEGLSQCVLEVADVSDDALDASRFAVTACSSSMLSAPKPETVALVVLRFPNTIANTANADGAVSAVMVTSDRCYGKLLLHNTGVDGWEFGGVEGSTDSVVHELCALFETRLVQNLFLDELCQAAALLVTSSETFANMPETDPLYMALYLSTLTISLETVVTGDRAKGDHLNNMFAQVRKDVENGVDWFNDATLEVIAYGCDRTPALASAVIAGVLASLQLPFCENFSEPGEWLRIIRRSTQRGQLSQLTCEQTALLANVAENRLKTLHSWRSLQ